MNNSSQPGPQREQREDRAAHTSPTASPSALPMMPDRPPVLMTADDYIHFYEPGRSKQSVYRLMTKLPLGVLVTLGRQKRIHRDRLDDMLATGQIPDFNTTGERATNDG